VGFLDSPWDHCAWRDAGRSQQRRITHPTRRSSLVDNHRRIMGGNRGCYLVVLATLEREGWFQAPDQETRKATALRNRRRYHLVVDSSGNRLVASPSRKNVTDDERQRCQKG